MGVNPKFLISKQFSRHTKAALNLDDDDVLTYYIDDTNGTQSLADGRTITTLPHTSEETSFIIQIFNQLGSLLAIDFERSPTNQGSDIDIYSVADVSDWKKNDLGEVVDQKQRRRSGSWWDVLWRDTDGKGSQNDSDLFTIIHEIGHALGLSHPKEKPYSKKWDSSDTVMSYNEGPNGWDTKFSTSDLEALQMIWGSSDGSVQPGDQDQKTGGKIKEFFGVKGSDDIIATYGDDDVYCYGGNDTVEGLSGDDIIYGGNGDDDLYGGKGDDILDAGKGENWVQGGRGRDTFVIDLKGYQIIDDFNLKDDEFWIVRGSRTYWKWGFEYEGNKTYIYDQKSGDDIAELNGRHNLNKAYIFG